MLSEELPYEIYPLDRICVNMRDLITTDCPSFLDKYGKIVSLPKDKFSKVRVAKIVSKFQTSTSSWVLELEGGYRLEHPVYNYERYARFMILNNSPILIDLFEEKPKPTRKKI
jgi:hypothetical protein